MAYYCGWDGGGTKTEVLCLDENGAPLSCSVFGPLNPNGTNPERVRQTVRECIQSMNAMPGGLDACKHLVIGTAGVSNAEACRLVTDTVRACGYHGPLTLLGDQEIALAGAIQGAGAVLVAGTGSICCGRDSKGNTTRVGGYGYLIDDGGSGYAIGRDILTAVVRAADGRDAPTLLTSLVYNELRVDSTQGVITWLYKPETGKKEIAALSPLLLTALEQEDNAALKIADKAAAALAELAVTAWHNLQLTQGELAVTGSILKRYPRIRRELERLCHQACPQMTMIDPRGSAAQGAALLAYERREMLYHG